ncbi:NADH-quinone oxidoreductase subunit C [Streptomyces bobili]|uniref:NADH-quinone oxidoreductase subunit C n=1 Tax=Streptomyces bobili TaxID=67280 RepID=A0ABZ1QZ35_9ACTN|nr:NADH-quinone oxidoreductase subunit C [Streptomyces bobili]
MTTVGWLPAPAEELFGPEATAEESYEVLTVDVPPQSWTTALLTARDRLSCTYFDWLSAVDEPGTGFRVAAHVVALTPVRRLLVRTTVPHEAPTLDSAVDVYAGAAWHERETHEMFGVVFANHPALDHLLLPETFEGHPLRKDFVLAARVAKAWPGAKEPGESEHGGPKRRQMLPPGVPDPNEWGPLKGQLPPAPARATRAPRTPPGDRPARTPVDRPARTPGDRPTGDRPVRRARTASEGSASQTPDQPVSPTPDQPVSPTPDQPVGQTPDQPVSQAPDQPVKQTSDQPVGQAPGQPAGEKPGRSATTAEAPPSATAPRSTAGTAAPRRSRSVSQGSASQRAEATTPRASSREDQLPKASPAETSPLKTSHPEEPAAQPPEGPRGASEGSAGRPSATPGRASRSADAPWHHARPAFEDPQRDTAHPDPEQPATTEQPAPEDAAPENDPSDNHSLDTGSSDNDTPANPQGGPQ